MTVRAVNHHDNVLFPESLDKLLDTANLLGLDLWQSYLTLDSAFDSKDNKATIEWYHLIPVIKPNPRGIKDQAKLEELNQDFNETIYEERYKLERTFAWQDTYRKLVIRYERLQCTHLGFKYLAYSMINFRSFFSQRSRNSL